MKNEISERDIIVNYLTKKHAQSNEIFADNPRSNYLGDRKLIAEILKNVGIEREEFKKEDGEYYYPTIAAVLIESFLAQGSFVGQFRSLVKTEQYDEIKYNDRNKFFLEAMDFLIDEIEDPSEIKKLKNKIEVRKKKYDAKIEELLKNMRESLEKYKNNREKFDTNNYKGKEENYKKIQGSEMALKEPKKLDKHPEVKEIKDRINDAEKELQKYYDQCEQIKAGITRRKELFKDQFDEYEEFHTKMGNQITKLGKDLAKLVNVDLPQVIGLNGIQLDHAIPELTILLKDPSYKRLLKRLVVAKQGKNLKSNWSL